MKIISKLEVKTLPPTEKKLVDWEEPREENSKNERNL
jgi:hypothetical protein